MDNKKPLIIGIIAFALLLGGAALLYQRMDPGSLGPAMTSSDSGSGADDPGEGGEQPGPPPTSRCSTATATRSRYPT